VTAEERARRKLLDEFQRTALDRIARVNVLWIGLESDPRDEATAEELLRELHTLKGESRMMGFSSVSSLTHRMEELALSVRQQGGAPPQELGDLVMDASDAVCRLLQQPGEPSPPAVELSGLRARFDRILGPAGDDGDAERPAPAPAPPEATGRPPPPEQSGAWPDEDFLRVDASRVAAFAEATFELRVRARRASRLARQLAELVAAKRARLAEVERSDARPGMYGPGMYGPGARVERADPRRPLLAELLAELLPLSEELVQETEDSELQLVELDAQVRSLRLVPIAALFGRYVRVIRDLGREHGKEVTAQVRDAGVHLDKAIIERLAGPLVHLFRNAIDHGIESAEERAAAGKPRVGCISLSAAPRDGMVALTIADDGRGIDPDRVRARAVELGLLGEAEARAAETSAILELVFQPGVSTRRAVTETSGRGIGLDAVKREIEHLGGHARIHSDLGRGTIIELQLPISIALTRVLVIRLGDARFGLPTAAISAVVSAGSDNLAEVHHRPTLRIGDEQVPLVELGWILGQAVPRTEPIQAIVAGETGRRIALAVSGWEGDQDVVVKPLGELLEAARLFSGACLLESGELALVLNPAAVTAQALDAGRSAGWGIHPLPADPAPRRKHRILFAEDSAVTRSMILPVLGELGYHVVAARDGKEALELLRERGADLVLTDLDMPVVGGVELIRRVRGSETWSKLPIIVLSTRGSEVDRRRALEAGADDYLIKGESWEATLREALRRGLEPFP